MPKLTWIGHSAFLLEDDEGNVVAVDPFIEDNPVTSIDPKSLKPGTILLTHAHNDHVGDTVAIAKRTGAKVIATFELGEWLKTQGVSEAWPANHGGTVAFAGGTAKFVPAWHTSSYFDGKGFVAPGVPAGLVVRFGGTTVYFAGDTAVFGDMALIGELYRPDIALLPIGGFFTMGPVGAARAAGMLGVAAVVPIHYATMPTLAGTPEELADAGAGAFEVVAPQPGEPVT